MISLKLTPDTRRKKKDNTYPLVFRIRCNRDARDLKTGFTVSETDWSNRTNFIKETHPEYSVIAPRITELKLHYMSRILDYEKTTTSPSIQEAKDFLLSKPKEQVTVYTFWEEEVQQLYRANRNGGAQVYKEALIAINKVKSLNVPFQKVDYNFLRTVETELLNRGVKLNTIGIHYRELRAIYNKAIKAKVVSFEHYPFRDYKIKKEKTRPRTVTLSDMRNYFALNLDQHSFMYDSWLMGQLMFMLIGINFKDMIMLTDADVKTDRVFYKRAKTKKLYSIKLLPRAEEILLYFKSKNSATLFGLITPEDITNREKFTLVIRQRNKVYNSHLAKLGKMIGCREKLTGYVFRYTVSNICKQLGYSKDLIAEALGHEYGNRVTGIYLEAYDKELVDEMNEAVYQAVTS
jgi:integrase/recombinase XerD